MRKLFTLTLALLASFSLWADARTYNFDGTNPLSEWTVTTSATNPPAYGVATNCAATSSHSFKNDDPTTYGKYFWMYFGTSNTNITLVSTQSFDAISDITLDFAANDNSKPSITISVVAENGTETVILNAGGLKNDFGKPGADNWGRTKSFEVNSLSGQIKFSLTATSSGKYAGLDNITVTHTPAPSCNEAEDEGSFVAASTALTITDLVANPSTTLTFTKGDNKSEPSFAVTKGGETTADASVVGTTFSATAAGTYIVTATQAVDETNNICEVIKQVTITVTAEIPVTACSIEGPTAGIIGQELTYTATAANATAFAWYVDGTPQIGETDAEFVYTGVKGNHSIYATATNAYTATPVASDPINLTVTKLCGELIKATLKGGTNADMSGVVGGTFDANLQSGKYKLDNGYYMGVSLSSGTFMAGDVVTIEMTTAGQNYPCLFADKDRQNLLFLATETSSALTYDIVLPLAAHGQTSIYLSRNDNESYSWNPVVKSISVTRSCEDSDDASVKSLTVNGVAVAKDAESNKFEYIVSTNYAEENVTVAFTIHPLATSDKVGNTFTIPTPSAGDTNGASFKVTAEDGTQVTYTVFISKAASLSNDATLKALSVAGLTLAPAFDAETTDYTVTKAYEADMPAVGDVTATANDANAKSVDIALAGNVFTITVTAEDNTTTKDYTITVNNAPAIKSLSRVLFSNGFDAFIDNTNRTVKAFYLDGTIAPTATTITAGANCTAGSIEDGKIVVTGADELTVDYIVTLEAVTSNTNVVEESAAAGTFDGSEAWVKAGLYMANSAGFDNGKYVLRRQLKSGDAADDQRVIAGWVRAYFFVGNASKLQLTVTDNKKLKYAIDGGNYTSSEDASTLEINLEAGNHMIEIVTNQSKGNCTLSEPKLVKRTATAIDNTADEIKAVKFVENGQLFIRRGEKVYTITGEEVK